MSEPLTHRTKLFVDATPLAADRISGIGHITYGLIHSLLEDPGFTSRYQIVLVAASRKLRYVKHWGLEGARYIGVPLPARVWNRLPGLPWLPPLDLFLGQGIYFFPNFRAWPLLRSKSVTVIHDLVFLLHPEVVAPRNQRFLAAGIRRWVRRSSVIATASQSSLRQLHDHLDIPLSRLRLIQWGVDDKVFYPRPAAEIEEVAKRYSLPENYILYLGNIEPRKNLVRLIQAYRTLPAKLKHRHPLVLVGGGGWLAADIDRAIADALAAGDQIIRPTQYVREADLPALYSGASLLAWPTLYEGFGVPPLQAMACGTPCVLSRTSSLPEVGQKAALYADSQSVSDISAKIKALLEDKELHRRLTDLGLENVRTFSWQRTVLQFRNVIDEFSA